MIDGADANNPFFGEQRGGQRPKYIISLEAVKEFQVVTDGASAEFGRSAGGFVNMVTKSGTNQPRGTGFYFGRYGWLLSENSDGTKDEDFSQHQFGGSLGGPIARDRTFFFFSYDQNEEQRLKSKAAFDDPAINPNGEGRRLLNILATRYNDPNEGGAENPMPQTNDALVLLGKVDSIALAVAPSLGALRLLDGRADQRHVRRADVDGEGQRHRARHQPFDRRADQQRVRTGAAERGQGAVRARASPAALHRTRPARHGDRQLPRRRRSLVPVRTALLPARRSGHGHAIPGGRFG